MRLAVSYNNAVLRRYLLRLSKVHYFIISLTYGLSLLELIVTHDESLTKYCVLFASNLCLCYVTTYLPKLDNNSTIYVYMHKKLFLKNKTEFKNFFSYLRNNWYGILNSNIICQQYFQEKFRQKLISR